MLLLKALLVSCVQNIYDGHLKCHFKSDAGITESDATFDVNSDAQTTTAAVINCAEVEVGGFRPFELLCCVLLHANMFSILTVRMQNFALVHHRVALLVLPVYQSFGLCVT